MSAAALVILSCGGERAETAADVETPAASEKTGRYLAHGTFFGGEVTDGKDIHDITWSAERGFERMTISVAEARWEDSENAPPALRPCSFRVTKEEFPSRLAVTVGGTRMFSAKGPAIPEGSLFRDFYRIIYLGDSGAMFAFDIREDTQFEVYEREDPAEIVIDLRRAPKAREPGPEALFSVRTPSYPNVEGLGHIEEKLFSTGAAGVRIIRDSKGLYFVEEGLYPTRREAEERIEDLPADGIRLLIEERKAVDTPRSIAPEEGR